MNASLIIEKAISAEPGSTLEFFYDMVEDHWVVKINNITIPVHPKEGPKSYDPPK